MNDLRLFQKERSHSAYTNRLTHTHTHLSWSWKAKHTHTHLPWSWEVGRVVNRKVVLSPSIYSILFHAANSNVDLVFTSRKQHVDIY